MTVKIELIYHKNYGRLNLYAEVTISTGRDEEYDFSKPDRALEYVNALSGFELSSDICLETAFEEEYAQEEWYGYTGQFRALDKFSYINANQFNYSNDYGSFRQLVFRINSLCK